MATLRRAVPREQISQVPYLPGIDGLRALAVAAVVVYHANSSWLHGGFLGVEVFLVISGYLITLLLIAEDERSGSVDLRNFWLRRARRLLPALFLLLLGLAVYTSLFYNRARASTRGDFVAAIAYVSNWFQVWVGAGYTAGEAFAPLRHLWSLAVEEQFYLVWPLIMVAILRLGRHRLPQVAAGLVALSLLITIVVALMYRSGDVAPECTVDMNGYMKVAGRCISVNDGLYLGTFSRAGGLLLGAAFAMLWRPNAIIRGPLRDRARMLDGAALVGALILALLMWRVKIISGDGENFGVRYDPWLFRGGFFVTGIATLLIIAAVTHRESISGRVLATPVLNWVGTRSYGLYLYHWPVYQAIRKRAGEPLSIGEFVLAMVITLPITELSYRYVETPIRKGQLGALWQRVRSRGVWQRPVQIAVAALGFMVAAAVASVAFAPTQCVTSLECDLEAAAKTTVAPSTTPPTTVQVATVPGQVTTVPPTTAAPTTVPIEARPPIAFGESVMLSAEKSLTAAGITVVAEEAVQASGVLENIRAARAEGRLGKIVIVQVGTNGTVKESELDAIMAELPSDQTVAAIFLTVHADRSWVPGNNELIRALPTKYANVKVVDWDQIATARPEILTGDGIHVEDRTVYAAEIVAAYQGT
jgi:peptidoglycan/LPS O-acetylase OafA/YrhL